MLGVASHLLLNWKNFYIYKFKCRLKPNLLIYNRNKVLQLIVTEIPEFIFTLLGRTNL